MGRKSRPHWARQGWLPLSHGFHDPADFLQLVLARGMHPDTGSTITKGPALRSAVRDGSLEIAELLLTHGADVNRKTFHGRLEPVIHLAAANGDTAMIKLLAAHGADLAVQNLTRSCRGTPLHIAVICNRVSAVRTLLDLHVPVDAENYAHRTPLDVATSFACYDLDQLERVEGMVEIGRMLVEAGAQMQCHEGGVGRPSRDRQDVEWQKDLFAPKEGEDVSG